MNEPNRSEPATVDSDATQTAGSHSENEANSQAATEEIKPANKLTPEEQMALFEKELKENDWGHQPC